MSTYTASRSKKSTGEKVVASSPQSPSSPSSSTAPTWVDTLLFWFDWSIKVVGIAAAVVFGIWAPLSYQAANNANASGDAAQSSYISAVFEANAIASSVLTIQSFVAANQSVALSLQNLLAAKQSVALDAMNSRIGAIGQLWVLDFCLGNTALAACESFTSEVSISSLVDYLASPPTLTLSPATTPTLSTTPTSALTSTPISTSTSPLSTESISATGSKSGIALSLPAILGIVFATVLFVGVIIGIFVYRLKRFS